LWLAVLQEEMAKNMAWAAMLLLLFKLHLLVVSGYLDGSFCLLLSAFFWLISAFFWRLCSSKIAYNVHLRNRRRENSSTTAQRERN
jgi:hypothetical protein